MTIQRFEAGGEAEISYAPTSYVPAKATPQNTDAAREKIAASLGVPVSSVVPNFGTMTVSGRDSDVTVTDPNNIISFAVKQNDNVGSFFDTAGNKTGEYVPKKQVSAFEDFGNALGDIAKIALVGAAAFYGLPALSGIFSGGAAAAAGELGVAGGVASTGATSGLTVSGFLTAPGASIGSAIGITNPYVASVVGNTIIQTATNGGDVGKALQSAALSVGLDFVGSSVSSTVNDALQGVDLPNAVKTGISKGVASLAKSTITGQDPTAGLVNAAVGAAVNGVSGGLGDSVPKGVQNVAQAAITASLTGKNVTDAAINAAVSAGTQAAANYITETTGKTSDVTNIAAAYADPTRALDIVQNTAGDTTEGTSSDTTAGAGDTTTGSGDTTADTFSDNIFTPSNTASADAVAQHYRDIVGHEPDPGGLKYWSDRFGPNVDATELQQLTDAFNQYEPGNVANKANATQNAASDTTSLNNQATTALGAATDVSDLVNTVDTTPSEVVGGLNAVNTTPSEVVSGVVSGLGAVNTTPSEVVGGLNAVAANNVAQNIDTSQNVKETPTVVAPPAAVEAVVETPAVVEAPAAVEAPIVETPAVVEIPAAVTEAVVQPPVGGLTTAGTAATSASTPVGGLTTASNAATTNANNTVASNTGSIGSLISSGLKSATGKSLLSKATQSLVGGVTKKAAPVPKLAAMPSAAKTLTGSKLAAVQQSVAPKVANVSKLTPVTKIVPKKVDVSKLTPLASISGLTTLLKKSG
jgi:hypothetical protein